LHLGRGEVELVDLVDDLDGLLNFLLPYVVVLEVTVGVVVDSYQSCFDGLTEIGKGDPLVGDLGRFEGDGVDWVG
jgi:hypothetical protein